MDDVNSLATDERTARVALAASSAPGDTTTGRLERFADKMGPWEDWGDEALLGGPP